MLNWLINNNIEGSSKPQATMNLVHTEVPDVVNNVSICKLNRGIYMYAEGSNALLEQNRVVLKPQAIIT